jgi:hypothetical protein
MNAASGARITSRRRTIAWLLALSLCAANLLLHLQISAACDAFYRWVGRATYEWVTLIGIGGLTLLAAAPVLRRGARPLAETRAWPALLVLGAIGVAAQESLLVSNVELIHFPQFALLAGLILATGLGPEATWLLASAAGIADEVYQYLVLYAGVPNIYLDYNDMVLNAIGAGYAVCLFVAARGRSAAGRQPVARRWRTAIAGISTFLFLLALWIAPPRLDPFWKKAATGRAYHVFSLSEGLLALAILWLLVTWCCRTGKKG